MFKPLGGSKTQGVTMLCAQWTFGTDGAVAASDMDKEGLKLGPLYGTDGNQGVYFGRHKNFPYIPSEIVSHYDRSDWYNDILGLEITFKSDGSPSSTERVGFETNILAVDRPIATPFVSYAPVLSIQYFSLDDGATFTNSDMTGITAHMVLWMKNSSV